MQVAPSVATARASGETGDIDFSFGSASSRGAEVVGFRSYVALRARFARSLPHTLPVPAKSGCAEATNLDAVPSSQAGKDRRAHFLTLPKPRAFVVVEDGTWRFRADDADAMTKALDGCARVGKRCWLHAVDDRVLWDADVGRRTGSAAQLRNGAAIAPKDEHQ